MSNKHLKTKLDGYVRFTIQAKNRPILFYIIVNMKHNDEV